jgi:hypothetical protein
MQWQKAFLIKINKNKFRANLNINQALRNSA